MPLEKKKTKIILNYRKYTKWLIYLLTIYFNGPMHVRFYTWRWNGKWEPWVYNLSIIKTNVPIESIYPCIKTLFLCSSRFSPLKLLPVKTNWMLKPHIVVLYLIIIEYISRLINLNLDKRRIKYSLRVTCLITKLFFARLLWLVRNSE